MNVPMLVIAILAFACMVYVLAAGISGIKELRAIKAAPTPSPKVFPRAPKAPTRARVDLEDAVLVKREAWDRKKNLQTADG
ncbi:hypothetical protein ACGFYQ_34025 [Streptomyces sp. NPDC048258]|uniref:hypothetical protein n=1 Tax=Streptomyces sp. NPDC048258 TaxID=3365527 RepID=UPI003710EDE3